MTIDARWRRARRVRRAGYALVIMMVWAPGLNAQLLSGVSQQRDLAFGTILTGSAASVAPTAAGAAMWRIHGLISLGGGISFTLPTTLSRVGGGATMPITFCSTCAVRRTGNTDPSGGTTFNPNTGTSLTIALVSDIYVWLGASVNPPLNQMAGSYTGTVVLTVAGLL